MPSLCSAFKCQNKGRFLFPKDPDLCLKWRLAVNRRVGRTMTNLWEPTKYSKLCEKHFLPEDKIVFQDDISRQFIRLKNGAIPCIFEEVYTVNDNERIEGQKRKLFETASSSICQVVSLIAFTNMIHFSTY